MSLEQLYIVYYRHWRWIHTP